MAEVSKPDRPHSERGETQAARCHLLELPAELRLRIYHYVYEDCLDFYLWIGDAHSVWVNGRHIRQLVVKYGHYLALPKTCRIIFDEAAPVLYQAVRFEVIVSSDFHPASNSYRGLRSLGDPARCELFRHVAKIRQINIYHANDEEEVARIIQAIHALASAMSRDRRVFVSSIRFASWSMQQKYLDLMLKGLEDLPCEPGATLKWERDVEHMPTPEALRAFVKKLGLIEK